MFTYLILPFLTLFTINNAQPLDIHEAVSQNKIKVEVLSKGGHSGDCMQIKIIPLGKLKTEISIPPGTHFIAENDPDQNIFVVNEQVLAFNGNTEQSYSVEGFCSQANDYSPETDSHFKMEMTKNKNLQSLADYMDKYHFSSEVKQASVWAVADGESVSSIYDYHNEKDTKTLRTFVCKMMNIEDQWYNTTEEVVINDDRSVSRNTQQIAGDVSCTIDKPVYLKCELHGADQGKMYDILKSRKLTTKGEFTFYFDVKVKGWKKGKYSIKVFMDDKEVHVQDFEV